MKKYDSEEIFAVYDQKRKQVLTSKIDWPITSIFDVIVKDKTILLNPEYQRHYVWDDQKASQLIESILLGIPLPTIYLSEEDGTDEVVDGQQRLTTIISFIKGTFPDGTTFRLKGLKELEVLNGATFQDLPKNITKQFNTFQLSIIKIDSNSHKEAKFDIFERINRGSVALSEQEIRNCIYSGSLNTQMKEIVKTDKFKKILNFTKRDISRMVDVSFIAAFLALSDQGGRFKSGPKTAINKYMERNKNLTEDESRKVISKFMDVLDSVYSVFGDKSFKRYDPSSKNTKGRYKKDTDGWENQPSFAIYLSVMLSFSLFPKYQVQAHSDEILLQIKSLMTDDTDFKHSLQVQTTADKYIHLRSERITEIITSIISDTGPRVFPSAVRDYLFNLDPTCKICDQTIHSIDDSHVDHIIRWKDGGRTELKNAQITHALCNQRKG